MIETLATAENGGHAALSDLGNELMLEMNQLFPIAEGLDLLGFVTLANNDIKLTADGAAFAEMDTESRKQVFANHLYANVPLAAHIKRVLDERPNHRAPRIRFETELEDHLNEAEAEDTLHAVISWGRYAELFSYDDAAEVFSLDDPE